MSEPAPLVVFSDDWGRHPSSCQHLVQRILPHRPVTWVNMIGLRAPRFDRATFARGLEKVKSWSTRQPNPPTPFPEREGGAKPGSQPTILNPFLWPSFRSRFSRGLNRYLLSRAARAIRGGPPPIVLTTLPLTADLVGRIPAKKWIYYCVDDYSTWPGLDGRTLQRLETELVAKVDSIIAVSETLQTHLAKLGRPSRLLTHGVDLDFWQRSASSDSRLSFPGAASPIVLFWGVIDRRMDLAFVRALSERMTGGTIVLVGPKDDPDPELLRTPRVRVLPPVPFEELPALAARASVLVAPYADRPVTRAMQPLKLKEYLATGQPVVVRRLPATAAWADCADVVETPEAFAQAATARLRSGLPEEQRRARARLESESWTAKAKQFETWIDEPGTG